MPSDMRRPARYVVNGIVATGVHFLVLSFCLELLHLRSAGVSNFVAAVTGIATSFLGSRYFVFAATATSIWTQLGRFWVLYAILAGAQGLILYFWSDIGGLDYRIGFIIGTAVQVIGSYLGGIHWVFRPPN